MKKSRNRKIRMAFLAAAVLLSFSGCKETEKQPEEKDVKAEEKEWEEAENTPYGKYPELVTYTLGQMSGANNSNLPETHMKTMRTQDTFEKC